MVLPIITRSSFQIGDRTILPLQGRIEGKHDSVHLAPVAMNVLLTLVKNAGEVVTRDELFAAVWKGQEVGDHTLTRCISELRTKLGDDHQHPKYIQTIPKRGYRLVAERSSVVLQDLPEPGSFWIGKLSPWRVVATVAVLFVFSAGAFLMQRGLTRSHDPRGFIILPVEIRGASPLLREAGTALIQVISEKLLASKRMQQPIPVSVAIVADGRTSIHDSGDTFNARWVIEGAISQVKGEIRISLTLVDARTSFAVYDQIVTVPDLAEERLTQLVDTFVEQVAQHLAVLQPNQG